VLSFFLCLGCPWWVSARQSNLRSLSKRRNSPSCRTATPSKFHHAPTEHHPSSLRCPLKQKALELLQAGPKPQLIVLDLEFTLWRAFVDSTSGPPFVYHREERLVLER